MDFCGQLKTDETSEGVSLDFLHPNKDLVCMSGV